MTALAQERTRRQEVLKNIDVTLASGQKAYKGAQIFVSPATGKASIGGVVPGSRFIGLALETVDATSADKTLKVDLINEIVVEWFVNGTSTDAVASTDLYKDVYSLDDQTVSILPGAKSPLGRVWAVDTSKGVAVELTQVATIGAQPAVASYTSNDWAPTTVIHGAIYDVPSTGAASTITLPAAAQNGTRISFCADGTKNGHTVQYRDGTGPANLTTALTASKRHLVIAQKLGGLWFANAYVSP